MYSYIAYLVAALVISLSMMPFMHALAFRVGAVDRGEGRKIHHGTMPRLGGVGVFAAFMLPLGAFMLAGPWDEFRHTMLGIVIAGSAVFAIGVYDDLRGARVRTRLAVETAAAVFVYVWGLRIGVIANPISGSALAMGWFSLPATVLWVVAITNAINLIDGIDGLSSGTGILIAATLIGTGNGDPGMTAVLLMLTGALAGFLRYNFPPASIFMGDSGSLFLGFLLANLSILSSQKTTTMAAIMLPFFVFSLPLLDMIYAVIRRYYRGLPISRADKEHIHHKLLDRGLSKKGVLIVLYVVNVSIMFMALLMMKVNLSVNLGVLLILTVAVILGSRVLGYFRFLPLIRHAIEGHARTQRRRYYSYLIGRFRADALRGRGTAWGGLGELARDLGFSRVRISSLAGGGAREVFSYEAPEAPAAGVPMVELMFDIADPDGGRVIGRAELARPMGGAEIHCTAELVQVVSEVAAPGLAKESP